MKKERRLPWYFILSGWLSKQAAVGNLKKGNWLDLMSGFSSNLQYSQKNNPVISKFYCLDRELDPNLEKSGFNLTSLEIRNQLPFRANFFDNVTIINGLEHLIEAENILKEIYRILKVNGRLQVVVPTKQSKKILEFLALTLKVHPKITKDIREHQLYYNEDILKSMLIKAGFKPNKISFKRIKFGFSLHSLVMK